MEGRRADVIGHRRGGVKTIHVRVTGALHVDAWNLAREAEHGRAQGQDHCGRAVEAARLLPISEPSVQSEIGLSADASSRAGESW